METDQSLGGSLSGANIVDSLGDPLGGANIVDYFEMYNRYYTREDEIPYVLQSQATTEGHSLGDTRWPQFKFEPQE